MRYFDRRFLFPVAAVTAFAQQQAPAPEAVVAEAALRARAEQFFQMQLDKKYRQAEAFVADDSKDLYYNGNKFNIKKFAIQKVEFRDNNTKAKVTMKSTSMVIIPVAGPVDIEGTSMSSWKIENGQWAFYVDDVMDTPFGPMKRQDEPGASPFLDKSARPTAATIQSLVRLDRNAVTLTAESPQQVVTVSNDLPGVADLSLAGNQFDGFKTEIDKKHLDAGEKATVRFTATGASKVGGVVQILVSPVGTELQIEVTKR